MLAGPVNSTSPKFFSPIADLLQDSGLQVCAISSSATMCCKTQEAIGPSIAEFIRCAEVATALDAPIVRVFGGKRDGMPWDEAIDRSVDLLKQLCKLAMTAGLQVAVETHDDWVCTEPLAKVIHRVRETYPNVGVLWDIHHPLQLGGEPMEATFRNIAGLTTYTHIKDSRRLPNGQVEYCLPGEGEVPIREILRWLILRGYAGAVSVEWEKMWHPELAEPEIALAAYSDFLSGAW
jgi:sugar phosphate isomerase/epimerase